MIAIGLAALGQTACESAGADDASSSETEARASAPLTNLGVNVPVTPSPGSPQGNETSATSALFANNTTVLLVSYNSQAASPWPDGTQTHCAWSRSSNGGATWVSTDDHASPLPGYGPGSNGSPYWYCLGDTYAVGASGLPGIAVMVAAARNKDSRRDVALWTSPDIGATWKNVARISDPGTAGMNDVDGPKVAFDAVNHTAWVWWQAGEGNTSGNWLRPVKLDAGGGITLLPTIDITAQLKVPGPLQASIAVKNASTFGGLPTIYLAYPSAGMTQSPDCTLSGSWTQLSVDWWLSVSTDGGLHFTSYLIDSDGNWPRCIDKSKLGGNRSSVSMAYDPDSQRVVLAYDRSMIDVTGNYVGTRVVTKQWPDAGGGTGFDTWIPICNPAVCPNKKTACLVNGLPPKGETYCNQWGGGVARRSTSTGSRAAVVWHDTRDTSTSFPPPPIGDSMTVTQMQSDIWGHSIRPGVPFDGPPALPGGVPSFVEIRWR